jgi:hypothetical protein
MKVYTVWAKKGLSGGVGEKCLINSDGDYIGSKSGALYSKEDYYHSPQIKAKIISVDEENKTGMYHLYKELAKSKEDNNVTRKAKFIGCDVTLEEAHWFGEIRVYRCLELNGEYFSQFEIELI